MLSSIVSTARAACALGLLSLGLVAQAHAVPPRAPSKPVVTSTLNFKQGDTNITGSERAYRLKWEDNSLDETGFKIEVRFGNTGPYFYVDTVGPNVTEYTLTYDFRKDTLAQFRVVAFKYHGNKVESAASPFHEERVTTGTANLTAPSDFRVESLTQDGSVNDGVLKFSWKDRSTNELYYQILYKKAAAADSTYATLNALAPFDDKESGTARTEIFMLHGLIPGESYNFVLRATRKTTGVYSTTGTAEETAVIAPTRYPVAQQNKFDVPELTPPTELSGEAISVDTVQLRWKDNSYNEAYYEIEYRVSGSSGTWTKQAVGSSPNTTSYQLQVGPGRTLEYRVRAVPVSTSTVTVKDTDYSDPFTIAMPFDPPGGLTATTSGLSNSVDLEWEDDSEGETAYVIYTQYASEDPVDPQKWYPVQSMLADSTRARVSTRIEGSTTVPLAMDVEHRFKVVAVFDGGTSIGSAESQPSNYATAYARHGFTSRSYHPAKVGEPFTYEMEVSNNEGRSTWAVENLPAGLTFNAEAGTITGIPEVHGVFTPQMTVTYQSYSNTLPLTLRILKPAALPTVADSFDNVTVGTGTQFDVNLDGKFADADSEKAVTIKTTKGDIDILLYPSLVPEAVANFMGYVESGAYNGTMFHRSAVGATADVKFVVQGGGYVPIQSPNYFASLLKRPAPRNEPGISNLRGTLAQAKVGGNPDSATHDFFFNMKDNSTTEPGALDDQNDGFTVFARVAGSGMSVVDAISNLPRGNYGTTTSNQIILDGFIYSSGTASPFQEIPIDTTASTAPTAMDNNLTVRMTSVKEVPIFKYEVASNSAPEVVRTSFYQGKLRLEGLLAGSSNVTIRAKDLDGNPVEQTFAVTVVKGYKAPTITRHPVSVAVLPGKKATLSVTATGTELQYEWRKKNGQTWTPVPGGTLKTLTFDAVTEAEEGEYQVVVSNGQSALTSNSAMVGLRSAPVITLNPVSKVVEAGKPLVLTGAATGAPLPAFSWLRTGRAVAGQKQPELNIPAIKVTEGGSYVMRASSAAGRADSAAASVIVVDKSSHLVMTLPGKVVTLKAQASGPNLIYRWKQTPVGGVQTDVVDDGLRIKGSSSATLTIKNFGVADAGAYTCVVYENDRPETAPETGAYRVYIAGAAPVLDDDFTPNVALVGIDYDYTLPFGGSNNSVATSFSITGLPAGLKMDSTSGRITGRATRSGEYTLKITAKNPKGSTTLSNIPFYVLPMPEAVVGTFVGQIGASPAINGNKGGRIDMTVTDAGLISGKLSMGKDILSFTGLMTQTVGALRTTGVATVTRKGGTPLQMVLSSIAPSGYFDSGNVTGTISDGENSVVFSAYRGVYSSVGRQSPYVGRQHLAFYAPEIAEDDESIPQGTGYAVATLSSTGVVKLVGKLADGTALTSSSFLGGQQQFVIYQSLYKNTGTLVGQAGLSYIDSVQRSSGGVISRTLRFRTDGQVNWKRDAQTAATERSYKAGYGPATLNVLGMTYVTPGDNELIMGLPKIAGSVSSNSSLEFTRGGLEDADQDPSLEALAIGSSPLLPSGVVNDTKTTLSLTSTKTTGLFSGGFNLLDAPALKRSSKYYGLVIPQIPTIPAQTYSDGSTSAAIPGENAMGVGFFTLSQLPEDGAPATALKTTPVLSGKVMLKPVPINITQQPQSQTVNPGTSVTFTVVANAQSAITYQWRRNGTNINNATSTSYTLSASEGAEGSFDVVLKTTYSTVVSEAAQLTVNDPVSNVKITRTPAENPVLAGTTVTFSATADGTGPFTYQWTKGSGAGKVDIAGATGVSYVIESAQTADMSDYSVKVFSSISTTGVEPQTVNALVVAAPITGVVATRSPDAVSVSIGGNITFSIPEIQGSAGPYQYQWKKDGNDIEGETSSSYHIEFVRSTDIGVYTVLVKNAVTPSGVLSNEVPLQVSTAVSNVNAYRNPSTQFVGLGSPVIFLVSVQGASPFTFQWKKNGEDIPGATLATYSISSLTEAENGNYTVLVANATTPEGVLSNPVALTALAPVTNVTITLSPDKTELVIGDTVELRANPNAPGPYSYQWFKDGEILDGKNQESLNIVNATELDAGVYHVEVSNVVNESPRASPAVTLSVSPP